MSPNPSPHQTSLPVQPSPAPSQQQHQQQPQHQQLQYQQQQQQQQHQQNKQSSPIPTQFRTISRNNSNTSTASSSNKGEFSSTISTTNSVTSSRSQLSRPHQLIDHRQLLATCGSSTPIRSFQRATISSVVKTRAFDNNPVLQGLLTSASPSGQNSMSNSQTTSPLSTPVFSRSRSLRMSSGPRRYQQSPSHHFRTSSRTPEIYSFNHSGDTSGFSNDSQARILELTSERTELKESLEFLECERQVLIDSAKELKDTLQNERSHWKKDQDDLKKQLTEAIAARVRAESHATKLDVELNDTRSQFVKLNDNLKSKDRQIESLRGSLDSSNAELKDLKLLNAELSMMMKEKLKFNGLVSGAQVNDYTSSDCISIVTEMARLRLELNEKDKIIEKLDSSYLSSPMNKTDPRSRSYDVETLNQFLDQTVECIKSWPEELAGSSHVQNLLKTLLSSYRPDNDELSSKVEKIHL